MKKILFFLLLLNSRLGLAGDSVENGAGLAEQNFQIILIQSENILNQCRQSSSCLQSSAERDLLNLLLGSLPEEKQNQNLLQFESNKKTGRFQQGSQASVLLTEATVGATIFINVDLIYTKDSDPMSEAQALKTLITALSLHQGYGKTYFIELFSLKIQTFFSKLQRSHFQ